jgi:hypothetical protein
MQKNANLAQLVEQFIRNEQVKGSSPLVGSQKNAAFFRRCDKAGTSLHTSEFEQHHCAVFGS